MAVSATPSVLIVEDEPALRKVLEKKISQLGCRVFTAADGESALKIITSEQLNLILMDVIMPFKNGFDVLQEMRTKHKLSTPVIIISNLEGANDMETGRNLGIDDYIIKSNISIRKLVQSVAGYLQKPTKP